jgi:hypothetical protein
MSDYNIYDVGGWDNYCLAQKLGIESIYRDSSQQQVKKNEPQPIDIKDQIREELERISGIPTTKIKSGVEHFQPNRVRGCNCEDFKYGRKEECNCGCGKEKFRGGIYPNSYMVGSNKGVEGMSDKVNEILPFEVSKTFLLVLVFVLSVVCIIQYFNNVTAQKTIKSLFEFMYITMGNGGINAKGGAQNMPAHIPTTSN